MELIILSEAGILVLLVMDFVEYLSNALTRRHREIADVLPYRPRSRPRDASSTNFEKAA